MPFDIGNIVIPKFDSFVREPKNPNCKVIDTKNIIAEILGGEKHAISEMSEGLEIDKVSIEGEYCIVLRYRREKDNKYYPAVVLGFDSSVDNEVIIRHIQGVKQTRIGYRFSASFDSFKYFIELMKTNFTEQGIKVYLPEVPTNLEGASYAAQSPYFYEELRKKLKTLNASIPN